MPIPYSGLHITARSLARFGLLFLNKGQWRGDKVVSSDLGRRGDRHFARPEQAIRLPVVEQQHGAWPGVPADAYAAMGQFDNDMLIVPSLDMIVIRQVGDDIGHQPAAQDRRAVRPGRGRRQRPQPLAQGARHRPSTWKWKRRFRICRSTGRFW